jgi:hypothetical protein
MTYLSTSLPSAVDNAFHWDSVDFWCMGNELYLGWSAMVFKPKKCIPAAITWQFTTSSKKSIDSLNRPLISFATLRRLMRLRSWTRVPASQLELVEYNRFIYDQIRMGRYKLAVGHTWLTSYTRTCMKFTSACQSDANGNKPWRALRNPLNWHGWVEHYVFSPQSTS